MVKKKEAIFLSVILIWDWLSTISCNVIASILLLVLDMSCVCVLIRASMVCLWRQCVHVAVCLVPPSLLKILFIKRDVPIQSDNPEFSPLFSLELVCTIYLYEVFSKSYETVPLARKLCVTTTRTQQVQAVTLVSLYSGLRHAINTSLWSLADGHLRFHHGPHTGAESKHQILWETSCGASLGTRVSELLEIMQQTFTMELPAVRLFVPHVLHQMPENPVHNPGNVKENVRLALGCAPDLTHLLSSTVFTVEEPAASEPR